MPTEQSFPTRFTQAQRIVIGNMLPALVNRLKLEEKNQRTILLTLAELKDIQQQAQSAISKAQDGMQRNSLRHTIEATTKAIEDCQGIGSIPASERLFQFKITLKETQPAIWRRIQVKGGTLDRLHSHFQTAMGWTNSHLHQFEINGDRYGDPELLDDGYEDFDCVDSTVTKISEIVPKDGKPFRFDYEYDFGDGWVHEVLFEGCMQAELGGRYPICLEGQRACPPEDVGGVCGYVEYLEASANPNHERHEEFFEWRGSFDPEEFDATKTTKRMRRGLPDWRRV